MNSFQQRTLRDSATLAGRGLHTGEPCEITLLPAEPNTGVVFVTEKGEVPALLAYVSDTNRGTTLRKDSAEVHTVEHLLAALAGLWVDNVYIKIRGPEVPAGDGSALPFVRLIESAGIREQKAEAKIISLDMPLQIGDSSKGISASRADVLAISVAISYQHELIGEQSLKLEISPAVFEREVAPARTFCTSGEIQTILSQGLGKGGAVDNVVIVYDDYYSVPLRFKDEFVRHKMLDLIGDISLLGARLHADVSAVKPSHSLNIAFVNEILRRVWQGG
jgi:UDP-3-O-acyl N-acetylglucosamine deacetylase